MAEKAKGADIPQSAKTEQRRQFLKKANKRKATRAAQKKINTKKITEPKPPKKAKKVK
jgi:hypothetical protein